MPAETIMNLLGAARAKESFSGQSKIKQQPKSSNNDFVSSLQQQQNSQQSNQQSKSSSKLNQQPQTNNHNKASSKQVKNNNSQADKFKIKGEEELVSKKKLKKLQKLLAKEPEELSAKDLEALLTNLSKILEELNQSLSQDMINKDQIKKLMQSITANQEQLKKLMNSFNSEQSNKLQSLLKELEAGQEKFLLETQQTETKAAKQQVEGDLKKNLKSTVQGLRKLLQETNAKVIKSNSNSKSSQNIANQKILSQFNLVKPRDNENVKRDKNAGSSSIDLKKLGEKLGQKLTKQENFNLKSLDSDKQVIDLKTVTNKSDANLDLSNLSNFKLGQFNTSAEVFNQSTAAKSKAAKTMNLPNILNQMNNKINFNAIKQGNKITMQLEPEFLGKIQMKVGVENGAVTAKILAESNQVKDLLNGNLIKLKSTLEQKGIEIDQFDVSVGYQEEELAEQENSQQQFLFKQQQERNKLNNFSLQSEEGQVSTTEQQEIDETTLVDDEVDYMA